MEIATAADHRLLAYLWVVTKAGTSIAPWALDAYARSGNASTRQLNIFLALETIAGLQPVSDRLLALGWAKKDKTYLKITDLGKIVLDELNQRESVTDAPVAIVTRPDDPVAYAVVIEHVARYDDVLLVDPYLQADALVLLLGHANVKRVLTSNKGPKGKARIASLAAVLATTDIEEVAEIRLSEDLHDRYIIPASGVIEHLGTSLNGIGKHLSVMTVHQDPVASEIRRFVDATWESATVLPVPKVQPSATRAVLPKEATASSAAVPAVGKAERGAVAKPPARERSPRGPKKRTA